MNAAEKPPGKPPAEKPLLPPHLDDSVPRDTIFHYSRERRLSRASPEVQALNEGKILRASLFRTLFSNNSHRMLFFVIILVFAASGIASRFMGETQPPPYQAVILGGNALALAITPVEEALFLVIIKRAPEAGEFHTGAVDIAVSPVAAAGEVSPVFTHRVFFNLSIEESFQISLPFEGADFFVVLETGEEQRTLRLRPGT